MKYLIIITAILLASCHYEPTYNNLLHIKRGITPADLSGMLNSEPEHVHNFSLNGRQYSAQYYIFEISREDNSDAFSAIMSSLVTDSDDEEEDTEDAEETIITRSHIIFLFNNHALDYWGFLYDYRREDDAILNQIGTKLYNLNIDEPGDSYE